MTTTKDLFTLWTWPLEAMRLGTDLAETMVGAQNVISARLPMMGTALTDPLHADHRELGRMVTEKVLAFRTAGKSVERASGIVQDAAAANAKAFRTVASGGLLWPNDWMRLSETNLAAAAALARLPATALAPIIRAWLPTTDACAAPKRLKRVQAGRPNRQDDHDRRCPDRRRLPQPRDHAVGYGGLRDV